MEYFDFNALIKVVIEGSDCLERILQVYHNKLKLMWREKPISIISSIILSERKQHFSLDDARVVCAFLSDCFQNSDRNVLKMALLHSDLSENIKRMTLEYFTEAEQPA